MIGSLRDWPSVRTSFLDVSLSKTMLSNSPPPFSFFLRTVSYEWHTRKPIVDYKWGHLLRPFDLFVRHSANRVRRSKHIRPHVSTKKYKRNLGNLKHNKSTSFLEIRKDYGYEYLLSSIKSFKDLTQMIFRFFILIFHYSYTSFTSSDSHWLLFSQTT